MSSSHTLGAFRNSAKLGQRRLALLGCVAIILSACGSGSNSRSAGEGVIEEIRAADRVTLPAFSGRTLDGEILRTSDYAGTVLVINVWGSWCAPCRAEAPVLARVAKETKSAGVQFIGIDVRDNDAAAKAFEHTFTINYPSIASADSGDAMLAVGIALPQNAVPSTLVVDRQGRVAARIIGASTYNSLNDIVTGVLEEGASGP